MLTVAAPDSAEVPCVDILGIAMFAGDIPAAAALVRNACLGDDSRLPPRCVTATDAHGLVLAQTDKNLRDILRNTFLTLPDGMPSVWLGHLKGARHMRRCYGPDFFAEILKATRSDPGIGHYFCGGMPGVADLLRTAAMDKFGNRNIVGTHCPPFRPLADEELLSLGRDIDTVDAKIVWIGISSPKQEKLASALVNHCSARFIITVGAAFDFHTGRVRQAPAWMQRAGLEWVFRLLMEPKRLYRRYLKVVPSFIFYAVRDVYRSY